MVVRRKLFADLPACEAEASTAPADGSSAKPETPAVAKGWNLPATGSRWGGRASTARPCAPAPAAAKPLLPEKATELPMGVQLPTRTENPNPLKAYAPINNIKHWLYELNYDSGYDGALVGSERVLLKTDAERVDFRKLHGIKPESAPPTDRKVLFVNGIWTDVPWQLDFMKMIAEHTGHEMVGLHNSTNTMGVDMLQAAADKTGLVDNTATLTLSTQLSQVLKDAKPGETIDLMAFSQGALVTSNALTKTKQTLHDLYVGQGSTDAQAWELAGKKLGQLKITTFGGGAFTFPPGPRYEHYVNVDDIVPMATGLGPALLPSLIGKKLPTVIEGVPGANGPVHVFSAKEIPKTDPRYYEAIRPAHALPLYLEQWQKSHGEPRSTWTAAQLAPAHRPPLAAGHSRSPA